MLDILMRRLTRRLHIDDHAERNEIPLNALSIRFDSLRHNAFLAFYVNKLPDGPGPDTPGRNFMVGFAMAA